MTYSPLSMSRRHVLGDLYARCDALTDNVPVYLSATDPEPLLLGHVDEALGHYSDAFSFHLPDDICKRLSAGHYTYSFGYAAMDRAISRGRIQLTSITLTARRGYDKPLPKRHAQEAVETSKKKPLATG